MASRAVLGLDIGTRMIKYCELRPGREAPELVSWGAISTPENCISNGVIVDPPLLASAIREVLANGGAKSRQVHCAVASPSSLVVRPIEVPRMNEAELAETMRWEVERYIPFAASEVIVDYKPLLPLEQIPVDAQNMEVFLAAGQEDMINAYIETLSLARLEPLSLDVESLASTRALVDINADQGAYDRVIALVNVGAGTTDVVIVRKGVVALCRPVPLAGDNLTNAISEGLGKSFEEAERLKLEEGMILFDPTLYRPALQGGEGAAPPPPTKVETFTPEEASGPVFDLGGESAPAGPTPPAAQTPQVSSLPTTVSAGDTMSRRVFDTIAPSLAEIVTEIRRSLDFYANRFPQARVEKVLAFGGTSRLPHFDVFLTNELGVPVELADPLRRLEAGGGADSTLKAVSPLLPIAVGMGIRDMLE
jgi:type IV pilus assembly protein PilM